VGRASCIKVDLLRRVTNTPPYLKQLDTGTAPVAPEAVAALAMARQDGTLVARTGGIERHANFEHLDLDGVIVPSQMITFLLGDLRCSWQDRF
jgi:hypothetical protein